MVGKKEVPVETTREASRRIDLIIAGRIKDEPPPRSYGNSSTLNGRQFDLRTKSSKKESKE